MASLTASVSRVAATHKTTDGVRRLLRLEGMGLLLAAVGLYAQTGSRWGLFAVLFLVPDVSLLFYYFGPRTGAATYNAAHATLGPLALVAVGVALALPLALSVAFIWLAHIGFDRALGYGLKYADGFSHTHLGWIGRTADSE
jgi:hypothetical protein